MRRKDYLAMAAAAKVDIADAEATWDRLSKVLGRMTPSAFRTLLAFDLFPIGRRT